MYMVVVGLDPSFSGFENKIDDVAIAVTRKAEVANTTSIKARQFIHDRFLALTKGDRILTNSYTKHIYVEVRPYSRNFKILKTDTEFCSFLNSLHKNIIHVIRQK